MLVMSVLSVGLVEAILCNFYSSGERASVPRAVESKLDLRMHSVPVVQDIQSNNKNSHYAEGRNLNTSTLVFDIMCNTELQ